MARGGLAISPNGGYLVYSATASKTGTRQLYLRPLDRNEAALMPGTDGAIGPFFSPDGEWIAFTASSQLKKVRVRGGTPIALCDKVNPSAGTWLTKIGAGSDAVRELGEKLLAFGPEKLKASERLAVMADQRVMVWLHQQAWLRPEEKLAAWWKAMIREFSQRVN